MEKQKKHSIMITIGTIILIIIILLVYFGFEKKSASNEELLETPDFNEEIGEDSAKSDSAIQDMTELYDGPVFLSRTRV